MTQVGMVCGRLEPEHDGVADYSLRLARALSALGVGAHVVPAGPRGTLRRRLGPVDLVHVQWAPTAYRGLREVRALPLLGRLRTPLVTTVHEYAEPAQVGRAGRLLERTGRWDADTGLLLPRSARVVVTNAGHAAAVRSRHRGIVPVLVPIGPNVEPAVLGPAARAAVRAELGLCPGAVVLVFFGFVHPVKGVRYLLAALAELRRTRPALHLLVVGGFESLALPASEARSLQAELRAEASDLGVADAVTFTGYRPEPEVARLLAAADVAVLPFTAGVTTKSGALLAAMAAGLPVAATRAVPADPQLVDGATVVDIDHVRDGTAVAVAVRRLLDDPALRSRVVAGGLGVAEEHSWPQIAARHAAVYSAVLAAVPGRG